MTPLFVNLRGLPRHERQKFWPEIPVNRRFLAPRVNGQFTIFLQNAQQPPDTLDAMKLIPHIIMIVCTAATFIANADEQLTANPKSAANQPTAVELQLLQGTWEGILVGDKARQKITITITGSSLHFHRDTNFWFETTITLPAGKNPKQLHATIKGCPPSQADSIGQVVRAFFKIEDGTLTLATIGDDVEETPKSFEAAGTRYELRKVQPQKKNIQPLKTR